MAVIQCPHCEKDVELENEVFGLFDCPYCDQEFEWEDDDSSLANPLMASVKLFFISTLIMFLGFYFTMLFDGPGENAFEWTLYLMAILSPVLIPIALLPSCLYLVRYWFLKWTNN